MIKLLPVRGGGASLQNIEEIYRRQFDMVYRISFPYLKNPSDTEDAAADVFAKLMKKGTAFQNAEHEKAWLIRTTINTCKDYLKYFICLPRCSAAREIGRFYSYTCIQPLECGGSSWVGVIQS